MPSTIIIEWHGPQVEAGARAGAARGINLAGTRLRSVAIPRTPLGITGDLRSSAAVVEADEQNLTGGVTYDTPYAARQHEELDYHHTDGEAKFLSRSMEDNENELQQIIGQAVKVGIASALS